MKLFIADDAALIREGLSGILERTGHEVVGHAQDAVQLRSRIGALLNAGEEIDVLVTDVRMPPEMRDDGLRAAADIRRDFPQLGVMVLSQYVAPAYASVLFHDGISSAGGSSSFSRFPGSFPYGAQGGLGYLLKDRVARVGDFIRSLGIVAAGGVVVDPEIAAGLVQGKSGALGKLSPREREVLELMAQGLSNTDIAEQLYLSGAAVSKHVANVFLKLGLAPGEENRRVRAVLAYLTASGVV
ncbi:response regulator transcription factor [Arcanobacterium hippocoleae]|uniref:DNA-binding NarL/FixJ family response regulator n=1 Tax=Arcanobacterium hippocoleae TaxID=149017 RepID=A0ABU1T3Q3_9ACTO|nr:response regulator transcription factor [Arcanobacterium hippocoleae]MDR6939496.1 DNA-binding NarL/FixJ family response regulator [Arcanobacterium hippocoleae]